MSSKAGISSGRSVSTASAGMTPSSFWRAKVSSRSLSQPWSNLPLYFSIHSFGTWCGAWRGARREVHEERLVGHQRLLLAHPPDRLVRHVLGEVVALFRRLLRLDRRGALVDGRIPLVGLAADEAVEVLEPAAAGRPLIERPHRARLPDRHFVAFAELRGRVAIELERHGERRLVLRQHRGVAGSRGRDLADAAHVDRMMIPSGQQRLAGRRAERGRVEAVELEPVRGQPLGGRRVDRAAERARRGEARSRRSAR